jgi:hypothetical protein
MHPNDLDAKEVALFYDLSSRDGWDEGRKFLLEKRGRSPFEADGILGMAAERQAIKATRKKDMENLKWMAFGAILVGVPLLLFACSVQK